MLYIADYVEELMDAVVNEVLPYEHVYQVALDDVKVPPSLASNIKQKNPVHKEQAVLRFENRFQRFK